ncbi:MULTISPECIES: hypothetical protein [unclassified Pseudomonas]|jgi:hypothetical protein|uniref:hypothetical protein n=1 Tax=unclassified Pseudomonas TaxID=196821 RepID=UPI00026FDBB1|nr:MULTISPECIES: hypothetical protein [unclassified Pseudomonas]EJL99522.1 hypothetical protein PMI19_04056 [Pseudomonas sp. GM16]EJM41653.1 hypothetical protein PMI23_01750 [Pseudomonas sp. GM24]
MKRKPEYFVLRGLLFLFDIENSHDDAREKIIVSKNVNDEKELAELFDILMKPEFLSYSAQEREWCIETLEHYLGVGDSFDAVFKKITTYFDDDVKDQRQFMQVLLSCLLSYHVDDSRMG